MEDGQFFDTWDNKIYEKNNNLLGKEKKRESEYLRSMIHSKERKTQNSNISNCAKKKTYI